MEMHVKFHIYVLLSKFKMIKMLNAPGKEFLKRIYKRTCVSVSSSYTS
jgi:hypothetical protein